MLRNNNMLKWEKRFDKLFPEGLSDSSNNDLIATDLVRNFIRKLRKRDERNLIKAIIGAWSVEADSETLTKIIKELYKE